MPVIYVISGWLERWVTNKDLNGLRRRGTRKDGSTRITIRSDFIRGKNSRRGKTKAALERDLVVQRFWKQLKHVM